MIALVWIAGVFLAATGVLCVVRIVRGPSILDRMIASDMLFTTLILVAGVDMVVRGHAFNIVIMLVLASTAIFSSITVARYVARQDKVSYDDDAPSPMAVRPEMRPELEERHAGEGS